MKKDIGLWIDHREAIIVTLTDGEEEIMLIESGNPKSIRYPGNDSSKTPVGLKDITSEDRRDRKFNNELNKYYKEVIMLIRDADSIKIFGPGEAKIELEKRIAHEDLPANMLATETTDRMTYPQILAKVRESFPA